MSNLGDTMSYGIAIFVIFVSFSMALFQNIGVMDQNNHFMSTDTVTGQNDSQVHDLVSSSTSTSNSQTPDGGLFSMGYLFLSTIIGGLYNAVIGLSGKLQSFYVPPIMAAGIQVAIDANFAYDLWILWKTQ